MRGEEPTFGPEAPRPAESVTIARLYVKYDLGGAPTLDAIEPVVRALWQDPLTRFDAIELALGRRVDAGELSSDAPDPMLGEIASFSDSGLAFGSLLMVRDIEQNPDPGPGELF